MVGAGIALLGVVATLILIRGRDSRAHVELGAARARRAAPDAADAADRDARAADLSYAPAR